MKEKVDKEKIKMGKNDRKTTREKGAKKEIEARTVVIRCSKESGRRSGEGTQF